VQYVCVRFSKLGPRASSQYCQKIQFEVSPGGGTLSSKGEGLQRGAKEHESVRFDFLTASQARRSSLMPNTELALGENRLGASVSSTFLFALSSVVIEPGISRRK
jgi:hypothetical protein